MDRDSARSGNRRAQRRLLRPIVLVLILLAAYAVYYAQFKRIIAHDQFALMGTYVDIKVVAPHSADPAELVRGARAEMERVVSLLNAYDDKSFVARLNALPTSTPLRVEADELLVLDVLQKAREASEVSGGAFDITFASVGRYWRFDPQDPRLPSAEEIERAKNRIDYRQVLVNEAERTVTLLGEETRIDLGGIAKGTVVDAAIAYLRKNGAEGALVNAGGDMFGFGTKPDGKAWRIGLQHPRKPSGTIIPDTFISVGGDKVGNFAVVTSGDYERSFLHEGVRYHHIIDPRTGMPSSGVSSVTVLGNSAEWADAMATAIFVLGVEDGLALAEARPEMEAILITDDLKVLITSGIDENLRTLDLREDIE